MTNTSYSLKRGRHQRTDRISVPNAGGRKWSAARGRCTAANSHLIAAKLRSSSNDAADGAREEVPRIVSHIRERWRTTSIVIRATSGFCRGDLMTWCEANNFKYVLGLAGKQASQRQAGSSDVQGQA